MANCALMANRAVPMYDFLFFSFLHWLDKRYNWSAWTLLSIACLETCTRFIFLLSHTNITQHFCFCFFAFRWIKFISNYLKKKNGIQWNASKSSKYAVLDMVQDHIVYILTSHSSPNLDWIQRSMKPTNSSFYELTWYQFLLILSKFDEYLHLVLKSGWYLIHVMWLSGVTIV